MTRRPLGFLERVVVTSCATHAREEVGKMTRLSICFQKLAKRRSRSVIRLHAQVISTVVESVFPVYIPPPAGPCPGWPRWARPDRTASRRAAGPGRACRAEPGRAGQLPAPGRASERDRRQGFGARDRAGLRHATGGRTSERDQASAHTTGPGFGTPLAQLIPRRRIGLCRCFPRFLQVSPC